jgi:hypothetical protein
MIGKGPAGGAKRQQNAKKMLNRGDELKDLLKIQGLAFFGAKNELKTNSILSAKSARNREQGIGNREQNTGNSGQRRGDREKQQGMVNRFPQMDYAVRNAKKAPDPTRPPSLPARCSLFPIPCSL